MRLSKLHHPYFTFLSHLYYFNLPCLLIPVITPFHAAQR